MASNMTKVRYRNDWTRLKQQYKICQYHNQAELDEAKTCPAKRRTHESKAEIKLGDKTIKLKNKENGHKH